MAAKKKTTKKTATKKASPKKKATAKKKTTARKKTTTKKTTKKATVKKTTKKSPAKKKTTTKKTTKKSTTKKKTTTRKPAKKTAPKKKRQPNAAFMKPVQPDTALSAVIGSTAIPRTVLTKKLWDYIKKNGLQDQNNRRMINADDKLKPVFGGKKQVNMFEMTKLVSKHVSA
jgi:upstream activation factor subunit UAF30